jgi:hypothetical protein
VVLPLTIAAHNASWSLTTPLQRSAPVLPFPFHFQQNCLVLVSSALSRSHLDLSLAPSPLSPSFPSFRRPFRKTRRPVFFLFGDVVQFLTPVNDFFVDRFPRPAPFFETWKIRGPPEVRPKESHPQCPPRYENRGHAQTLDNESIVKDHLQHII